jgi:hypothetical protein
MPDCEDEMAPAGAGAICNGEKLCSWWREVRLVNLTACEERQGV